MKKIQGILLDMECERVHQICSSMWEDNFWIMSHSNDNLEHMLRDVIEEGPGTQTSKCVVDKYV